MANNDGKMYRRLYIYNQSLQEILDEIKTFGEVDLSEVVISSCDDEIEVSFYSSETAAERKARLDTARKNRERAAKLKEQNRQKELELFLRLKAIYEPADTDSP